MQIPTINSGPGRLDTGSSGPQSSPIDFGWGDEHVAQGFQVAADRAGQQLDDVYEKANAATAQNALVQSEVDWTNNLNQAKISSGPHDTSSFMSGFNDYIDKTSDGMNGQAADMYRQKMQTMGVGVFKQSLAIEARKTALDAVGNANKNYDALTNLVTNNPATLPDALALVDNGKDSLPAHNAAVATASTEAAKTSLVGGAVSGSLLLSDPTQANSIIQNTDYSKYLDEGYVQAAQSQINLQSKVNTALDKEDLQAQRMANLSSIAETGTPVAGYDMMRDAANHAKNPQEAGELYNKMVDARNGAMLLYQAKSATFGTDYASGVQALNGLKPDPGDPSYNLKFKAWQAAQVSFNAQRKVLRDDPYQYTLNGSPTIADLQNRANNAFSTGDTQTGQGLQVQAIRQSVAIQKAAGIPDDSLAVTDSKTATSLASDIVNGSATQGLGALQRIQTVYGPYASGVFTAMQKLPEKDRLPAGYQVVAANLDDPKTAQMMLTAVRNNAANKTALESGSSSVNTNIRGAINTDPTFAAYRSAVSLASPDGPAYVDGIAGATEALARQYTVNGDNYSVGVSKAVQQVIGRQYGVQSNPDGSHYLIPAKTYTPDDQTQIASYLNDSLTSLGKNGNMFHNGDVIPVDPKSVNPGMSGDAVSQKLLFNALPKNAYWSSLTDGSGVQLFVNTPDGRLANYPGVPVRALGGSPIVLKYADIKANQAASLLQADARSKDDHRAANGIDHIMPIIP